MLTPKPVNKLIIRPFLGSITAVTIRKKPQ